MTNAPDPAPPLTLTCPQCKGLAHVIAIRLGRCDVRCSGCVHGWKVDAAELAGHPAMVEYQAAVAEWVATLPTPPADR